VIDKRLYFDWFVGCEIHMCELPAFKIFYTGAKNSFKLAFCRILQKM
jgi:hypothetical protein